MYFCCSADAASRPAFDVGFGPATVGALMLGVAWVSFFVRSETQC
jgi:hypothetical protein